MSIHLHIERLVLEGLEGPPGDAAAIAGAAQRELAALTEARALSLTHGFSIHGARGVSLPSDGGMTAQGIGQGIARSVYGQLNPDSGRQGKQS